MSITMKNVTMKADGSPRIALYTPYHPDLPAKLRALGGKWNDGLRAWLMPPDLEKEIRQVCLDFFWIDPMAETPADLVNVKITLDGSLMSETYWILGRAALRRAGRDSSVQPGDGVSILGGGFARSGGSRNNPRIGRPDDGTVILVRDVPRSALEQFVLDNPSLAIEIIEKTAPERAAAHE